jgi:hypothetical protein
LGGSAAISEQMIKDSIATLNATRNLTVVWAPDNGVAVV